MSCRDRGCCIWPRDGNSTILLWWGFCRFLVWCGSEIYRLKKLKKKKVAKIYRFWDLTQRIDTNIVLSCFIGALLLYRRQQSNSQVDGYRILCVYFTDWFVLVVAKMGMGLDRSVGVICIGLKIINVNLVPFHYRGHTINFKASLMSEAPSPLLMTLFSS